MARTGKPFYRSRGERRIAGVCGGMAEYLGLDPLFVRLAMIALIPVGGSSLWFYLLAWIFVPPMPLRTGEEESES